MALPAICTASTGYNRSLQQSAPGGVGSTPRAGKGRSIPMPGKYTPTPKDIERFWSKVDRSAGPDACWLWKSTINAYGYGRFNCGGRRNGSLAAHRVAYEELNGEIPNGLVIDHLCRVRHCVNPAHMETVTSGENVMRGMSPSVLTATTGMCRRGHVMSDENTYVYTEKNGRTKYRCRECARAKRGEYRSENRDEYNRRAREWQAKRRQG